LKTEKNHNSIKLTIVKFCSTEISQKNATKKISQKITN